LDAAINADVIYLKILYQQQIFHWLIPSDPTMVLGSTRPVTEMITRGIVWG